MKVTTFEIKGGDLRVHVVSNGGRYNLVAEELPVSSARKSYTSWLVAGAVVCGLVSFLIWAL